VFCKDYDASYVEQAKRQLDTRIKEHSNNVKLNPSVISHTLNFGHKFN